VNRTIDVGAAAGPKDVDGDGNCEAAIDGDVGSEGVGDDRISVLFIVGDSAVAVGGGDNDSLLEMDAEGTDATIGPIGGLEETGDDEESKG
jgi:hypothetical protein